MDVNLLLTPVMARIVHDAGLPVILGGSVQIVKSAQRSSDLTGNIFTIFVLDAPQDPDFKAINGTLCINFYCPTLPLGIANAELMGPVSAQIELLFDDLVLTVTGYNNYDLTVLETVGPLFDKEDPGYHFNSTRINFKLKRM